MCFTSHRYRCLLHDASRPWTREVPIVSVRLPAVMMTMMMLMMMTAIDDDVDDHDHDHDHDHDDVDGVDDD